MKELQELLQVRKQIGPIGTGKRFITLECRCEFEAFTSEGWDEVWELHCEVPNGLTGLHIRGKSYNDVIERAKAILKSGYGQE